MEQIESLEIGILNNEGTPRLRGQANDYFFSPPQKPKKNFYNDGRNWRAKMYQDIPAPECQAKGITSCLEGCPYTDDCHAIGDY